MHLNTLAGGVFSDHAWPELLAGADAVMLVVDPQLPWKERSEAVVRLLARHAPSIQECVVVTKQDRVATGIPVFAVEEILADTHQGEWPVFLVREDQPDSFLVPVEWLAAKFSGPSPPGTQR